MKPSHQVTMLKFIKNLSMLATTHEAMQNSNAIEVLTDLFSSSDKLPQHREISNNVLHILFNLCRLNKSRQEDAALSGLIPLLQRVVETELPLKELALPILCDMAHSGYVGRKVLWQHQGLQFYVSLLADKYWQTTALDAIFVWLQEETAKVEQHLLDGSFCRAIVDCFNNVEASPDAFENLLDPLQKLLVLSPTLASTLAQPDIFLRTAGKLTTKKAVVRGNLLRIIRSICDASIDQGGANLIRRFGLYDAVEEVADNDQAVMVRELASELIKSCDLTTSALPYDSTRARPGARRSSSSAMSPSPIASSPQILRTATNKSMYDANGSVSKYDLPRASRLSSAATPFSAIRPVSRDGSASSSGSGSKSRLPRTSHGPTKLSRLSLASQRREQNMNAALQSTQGSTRESVGSPAANSRTRLAQARQRRLTSTGAGNDGTR
jgi:hypothetical protein